MTTPNESVVCCKRGVPQGWSSASIREMIGYDGIFADGDWIESKDQDPNGDVRLIQLADIGDGHYRNRSNRYLTTDKAVELQCTFLKPGDVLIARMPDPLGRACTFPGDSKPCVTAVDVCIIRTGTQGPERKWLMFALNSLPVRLAIETLQSGTTRKRISRKNLERLCLPLPPLPEQQRIVAKIEELFTQLDAGVEALRKVQAQLKRYRQSVLKAAVEGRLTAEWRETHKDELEPAPVLLERIRTERRAKWEAAQLARFAAQGKAPKDDSWKARYQEPPEPDTSDLPALPEGWCWTTLPELGELDRGKSKHRPRNDPHLYEGPYPFVQTGDVRKATGILKHYSQTYSEAGLGQSRLWPTGTLCITIAANIADTAILGFDACFPDSVVGFTADPSHCDVRFIELFMRTAQENLERYAPATAQKNINLGILREVAVPLCSFEEQNTIVQVLEQLLSRADEVERTAERSLKQAERLRQSILKKAFEGRLVPQDPTDEPAEQLLERIKTEKAQQEAAHPQRNRSKRKQHDEQGRLL